MDLLGSKPTVTDNLSEDQHPSRISPQGDGFESVDSSILTLQGAENGSVGRREVGVHSRSGSGV